MSQRDEHWGAEDEEVVRRLRDEKPRISRLELDRIKTTVMARVRPSTGRRAARRSRLLVALMTVGLMVAGTAGTIAGGNTSLSSGTGAAQSQYRPPKCNPRHEECKCPDGSVGASRDACKCPAGETFAEGTNDCRCPDGSRPTDAARCVSCPDGSTVSDAGRCVCPDQGTVVGGKCVRKRHEGSALGSERSNGTTTPKLKTSSGSTLKPTKTPVSATAGTTDGRKRR